MGFPHRQYNKKYVKIKTLKMVQEKQNSDKLCNIQQIQKNLKIIKSKTMHRCNADLHTVVRFSRFFRIFSRTFTRIANWPALLFILGPLVKTEPAEKITLVMELSDGRVV